MPAWCCAKIRRKCSLCGRKMLEKASNAKKNSDAFYVWKCQKLCRPILSMANCQCRYAELEVEPTYRVEVTCTAMWMSITHASSLTAFAEAAATCFHWLRNYCSTVHCTSSLRPKTKWKRASFWRDTSLVHSLVDMSLKDLVRVVGDVTVFCTFLYLNVG